MILCIFVVNHASCCIEFGPVLVCSSPMVWIQERVVNSNEKLVKRCYMVISSDFGVLWPDGMDSGVSSWFQVDIGEGLLMVIIAILVCSGPMVEIQ